MDRESLETMLEQLRAHKMKLEEEIDNVKNSIENIESELAELEDTKTSN